MGQSTDGLLVWGFAVEEGSDDHMKLAEMEYDEKDKIEKEHGGEVVRHCCNSEEMFIIGLKSMSHTANRGDAVEITELDLLVPEDAAYKLQTFARALGVEPKPGKWLLAVWWDG